jgi:hypothetical protein
VLLALYRAQPVSVSATPELHSMVAGLVARSGPHRAPALYSVPGAVPNCFCVGHGTGAQERTRRLRELEPDDGDRPTGTSAVPVRSPYPCPGTGSHVPPAWRNW